MINLNKYFKVTVVSIFPPAPITPKNYKYIHIELENDIDKNIDKMKANMLQSGSSDNYDLFFVRLPKLLKSFIQISVDALSHPAVEQLKQNEQFDLVIIGWFFNDYQLGLAAHFQCPSVLVSTVPPIKLLRDYVGNPIAMSYIPSPLLPFKGHMTFLQRLINFGVSTVESVGTAAANYLILEPYYREYFPEHKYPTFDEVKKNVSLVLLSNHVGKIVPTSSYPALVDVSGMHMKSQPLAPVFIIKLN